MRGATVGLSFEEMEEAVERCTLINSLPNHAISLLYCATLWAQIVRVIDAAGGTRCIGSANVTLEVVRSGAGLMLV